MAFKNAAAVLTTVMTPVYTCPAGKEAVVHSIFATPMVAVTSVSVAFTNAALLTTHIGKEIPVITGGSLYFPKPMNLAAGESLDASCQVNGDIEFVISILEQDVI